MVGKYDWSLCKHLKVSPLILYVESVMNLLEVYTDHT